MRLIDADALAKEVLFCCNQEIIKYKSMRHALGNVGRVAFDCVKNAPTIDAEPVRRGEWEPVTVSSGRDSWQCSKCGRRARGKLENLPYCHCGAKMDAEVKDE